jgi:hypothetical protein
LISPSFEVNTDTAFIDPDWEEFASVHDRRYGLAIAYVKESVTGVAYGNKAMDLVVGDHGFYVQSKNFPAAFYGETGLVQREFLSEAEAQAIAWEAVAHYRAGEAQSLTCVYSSHAADVFFGYRFEGGERYEMGQLRVNLPLHLRVMIDAAHPMPALGHRKGVIVYQRTQSGQHLLLKAPGRRQPFPLLDGIDE